MFKIDSVQNFIFFWLATSVIGLVISFLLVRRQAFKEKEPFWSPPTRRVAQALAPPLSVGLILAILYLAAEITIYRSPLQLWLLPVIWMTLYGCALHSAGFFMARGIRFLGWIFIFCGLISLVEKTVSPDAQIVLCGHVCMGVTFGGLHLIYGIYLYFTEKKLTAA